VLVTENDFQRDTASVCGRTVIRSFTRR